MNHGCSGYSLGIWGFMEGAVGGNWVPDRPRNGGRLDGGRGNPGNDEGKPMPGKRRGLAAAVGGTGAAFWPLAS